MAPNACLSDVYCRIFLNALQDNQKLIMDMDQTPQLQVEGLSRFYSSLQAVKNISFEVRQGEILGFLGPNGAGKTTTMQMLTGNLAPSQGRITVVGHDLLEDPRAAKAAIGYLPEQPPVYRELTVDEYLDYCSALNRIPAGRRRAARDAAKEKCGLVTVGHRLIGNLSKGYQQRVGIAQAIIHLPPVIILDEPTAGLDPIQIREIRHLIRELGREHSIILSTHILPEVQSVCNHVQIINKGELVLNDSIEGLAQRMQSSILTIRLRRPPGHDVLAGLPGVKNVESTEDGSLRLYHEPSSDPTDALLKLAVDRDWGLTTLLPQRATIEDIFLELTTEDTAHTEATA
jgi:ABC-2 type transport system ATP-binding protein